MHVIASTDGVELAVHELGGTGRPLLFCHATGMHGRVWEAVAAQVGHRRCLAIDFRGFGDSTAPANGNFDWHGFGDDILAVVDHLALTEVQAVGHSKGGAAMLLAEIARPGTFERMICFEPIAFPSPPPGDDGEMLARSARRRRVSFDSHDGAVARFASRPPLDALRADVLDAYVRHGFRVTEDGSIVLKTDPEHEARSYESGAHHDAFDHLAEVACPVLVVHGGDRTGPAGLVPMIADRLPAGLVHSMVHVGHFGPLEDPAGFGDVVGHFLDRSASEFLSEVPT